MQQLKPNVKNSSLSSQLGRFTRMNRFARGRSRGERKGVAALWVILVTPAVLLMLCFVADVGKIWLARVELENGLEAAALAGARTWGEAAGGPTTAARGVAIEFAAANTIGGNSLAILSNFGPGNPPNENDQANGNLVFGSAIAVGNGWMFDPSSAPDCNLGRSYAVRAQSSATVMSLCDGFLGINFGPYSVTAETTAIYDCNSNQPRIVFTP